MKEHGEAYDSTTENTFICNIYGIPNKKSVYGIEFIVDASKREVQDEDKIQDAAQRLSSDEAILLYRQCAGRHAPRSMGAQCHTANPAHRRGVPGLVGQST